MSGNSNLNAAISAKKDEFYTQLTDIEKELEHYKHHFKDKVIYFEEDSALPFDDDRFAFLTDYGRIND